MTTEEKLQVCVNALKLMCKPADDCTLEDIEELERYLDQDELAYDTLEKIGLAPPWPRPALGDPDLCHLILPPGNYNVSVSAESAKPNLKLVK